MWFLMKRIALALFKNKFRNTEGWYKGLWKKSPPNGTFFNNRYK